VYKLILHSDIVKTLQKITRDFATKIAEAMRGLRVNPHPPRSKHISENIYRLREGDYWVIYGVFESEKLYS
jgi:mRNA-degrading endonuclease RelE of RelBE toxin-antitoxin system